MPLIHFTLNVKIILILLHLIGAVTWIGALSFYVFIFRPSLSEESPLERSRRIFEAGRKLDVIVWSSLAILLVTGIWNTISNPISVSLTGHRVRNFAELELLGETAFGSALRFKHGFFLLLISLMGYRSFNLLPRLGKAVDERDTMKTSEVEIRLGYLSIGILLLGYIILFFASIVLFSLR
jgi:uncharacterized membrane protein